MCPANETNIGARSPESRAFERRKDYEYGEPVFSQVGWSESSLLDVMPRFALAMGGA